MRKTLFIKSLAGAVSLICAGVAHADDLDAKIMHVLMVSVDGMHQQDLNKCVASHTCPHIAELVHHGATYSNAFTPGLSDSVPGLAALVTGGSPRSTGLFYDDIYDRTLFPGTDSTCSTTPGVEVFLQEVVGIDAQTTNPVTHGALAHLDGGGDFNPEQLPRRKVGADCKPVYPHDFIQTNTIFEVIKQNLPGSHTAWADKHAWGTDWVNGPSGKGVDDLARTEINSIDPSSPAGSDYTQSFSGNTATDPSYVHTETFDNIHLQNILNEIGGKDSTGTKSAPVPTIFGTNFQTLSVAQKALNSQGGGYVDAAFTPNVNVAAAITYIDNAIGQMTDALERKGLRGSTLFIVSAKHGQSPANYSKLKKIGHAVTKNLGALVDGGSDAITGNNIVNGQVTDDDVAFVWLNDQSKRSDAVALLQANSSCPTVDPITKVVSNGSGICADHGGSVIDLSLVQNKFGDPAKGRTPDIMVQPNSGVIYSKSGAKDMEHGGFAADDGHVALLVSNPRIERHTVKKKVQTTQVAPTIVKALGLNPSLLLSVQREGTRVLPGVLDD